MSFALTNASATFTDLMNCAFKYYLDTFVIIFIDNLLDNLWCEKDHVCPLRIILQTFIDKELYAKLSKCEFSLKSMAFLGHIISCDGIKVDTQKINIVQIWPTPISPTNVRSFFGFDGLYRRFLEGFSSI